MADVGVFSRYKSFGDFRADAEKQGLANAIAQASILKTASGQNLPAPLQLANEYQKRLAAGDTDGANAIAAFAKTTDKGLVMGPDGNYYVASGYAPAVSEIAGAKATATEQGKKNVQAVMNPIIAGGVADAKANVDIATKPKIAAATKEAENTVDAKTNLSGIEANANEMLNVIENLKNDKKGMRAAVGFSSIYPTVPGGDAANYEAQLKRLQGATFLEAYQKLKGGGAITEVEGKKAENAIAALQTNQSEAQFKRSLTDLEQVVKNGVNNARKKAASTPNAADVFGNAAPVTNFEETMGAKPITGKAAQESLFNARKAIRANPAAREAIINKLRSSGIDPRGL